MDRQREISPERRDGRITMMLCLFFLLFQAGTLLVCWCNPPLKTEAKCAFSSFCRDLHTPARPERPGEQIEARVRLLLAFGCGRRGQNERFSGAGVLSPDLFSLFILPVQDVPSVHSCLYQSSGIFTNHPARAAPVCS